MFLLHGFDPYVPWEVTPEGALSAYQLDWDDYNPELFRGMQLIRTEVREYADRYQERMKSYFDAHHVVEKERLPKVVFRVFMKLTRERCQKRHPKLSEEWYGPFRVIE